MSVVAIIAALVIEQWRPLGERKGVSATLAAWAGMLERSFNGGEREHGPQRTGGPGQHEHRDGGTHASE